jgi:hypothetical protein
LIGPSPQNIKINKKKQKTKNRKLWRLPKIEVSIGRWERVPFGSKHMGKKCGTMGHKGVRTIGL